MEQFATHQFETVQKYHRVRWTFEVEAPKYRFIGIIEIGSRIYYQKKVSFHINMQGKYLSCHPSWKIYDYQGRRIGIFDHYVRKDILEKRLGRPVTIKEAADDYNNKCLSCEHMWKKEKAKQKAAVPRREIERQREAQSQIIVKTVEAVQKAKKDARTKHLLI